MKIEIKKQVLRGPGALTIQLDPSQCCPKDPGAGEPIVIRCGRASATYCCARNEGWRLDCGDYELTPEQVRWLDSVDAALSDWDRRACALAKSRAA